MTTLLLREGEFREVASAADGALRVELTEDGARRLVDLAERHKAALEAREGQRAAWLRSLSNAELVELAGSHFGGPPPDVVAEAGRRMRECAARLRPALRALGLAEERRP